MQIKWILFFLVEMFSIFKFPLYICHIFFMNNTWNKYLNHLCLLCFELLSYLIVSNDYSFFEIYFMFLYIYYFFSFINSLVSPAGHLWACWFLYNVGVKLNQNSFPKVLNPFPKVLLVKLVETEFKLFSKSFELFWFRALFQRLWVCFGALSQRLVAAQPFSKGIAWLRSFPKPFWRLPFPKLLPLRCQEVSLHCLCKVVENQTLMQITMLAPLGADGINHQAILHALLGHL